MIGPEPEDEPECDTCELLLPDGGLYEYPASGRARAVANTHAKTINDFMVASPKADAIEMVNSVVLIC